jgi:hypothetical protein
MENKGHKKSADKVFEKQEKNEKEETKEQEKKSARLAERKGQRPAFPFSRKRL